MDINHKFVEIIKDALWTRAFILFISFCKTLRENKVGWRQGEQG